MQSKKPPGQQTSNRTSLELKPTPRHHCAATASSNRTSLELKLVFTSAPRPILHLLIEPVWN